MTLTDEEKKEILKALDHRIMEYSFPEYPIDGYIKFLRDLCKKIEGSIK